MASNKKDLINLKPAVWRCALLYALLLYYPSITKSDELSDDKGLPTSLIIATTRSADDPMGRYLRTIYREAFKRLGIELNLKIIPAKRIPLMMKQGLVAGDVWRVWEYGKVHPEFIRIPEPIYTSEFSVFSCKPETLSSWLPLVNTDKAVVYRRGIVNIEKRLQELNEKKLLIDIDSSHQAVQFLKHGRAAYYVDLFPHAISTIMKLGHTETDICPQIYSLGVIEKLPSYGYLGQNYKSFSLVLSKTFKALKDEGFLEKAKSNMSLM